MATGRVKFFNRSGGFGFIVRDDDDIGIYLSAVEVKDGRLSSGDRVEFDVEQGKRGSRTRNLRKIKSFFSWSDHPQELPLIETTKTSTDRARCVVTRG